MPGPRALVVGIAMLAAGPASAQDALRGKRLYLDAARIVGSGVSCVDCHGGLPGGAFGIGRAADDPAVVENAVGSVPQMTPFRGRLAGADFADLAAYIGNPAVPSPQVQLTTRLPNGAAGPADRIDFGEIEIDTASAVATLQIANPGLLAFAITAAPEVAGANAAELSIEATDCRAGMIMAPAQACSVELRFRPVGAAGARTARLGVPHDWVYGIAAVALLGSAAPPTAPPPPASTACSSSHGNTAWPLLALLVVRRWVRRRRRRR
jgi:mono/diheme cytochrome c family protein